MDIGGQSVRDFMARVKHPLGYTTAPRVGWMLFRGLPLPGIGLISRGLGRLAPLANFGLAIADIWLAVDDWIMVRHDPQLDQLVKATLSTVLACCSSIAALNIPLISQMSAILAILTDFLKQSLISLAEEEEIFKLRLISNPSSNGALVMTPDVVLAV